MQFDILPLKFQIFQPVWKTYSKVRVHNLDFFQWHLRWCIRKHLYIILKTFQPTGFPHIHLYENTKENTKYQSPDKGVHLYCKEMWKQFTTITPNKTCQTNRKNYNKGATPPVCSCVTSKRLKQILKISNALDAQMSLRIPFSTVL